MRKALVVVGISLAIVILGMAATTAVNLTASFVADWRFMHEVRLQTEQAAREQAKANAHLQQDLNQVHRGEK